MVSKARCGNTMVGHASPSYFSSSLVPKLFCKWLWKWKWKLKVTFCFYMLLLYIYNMSSELNLLELYLNLLEHRDPIRFSDVFAPYRGFGEFSEHMRILGLGTQFNELYLRLSSIYYTWDYLYSELCRRWCSKDCNCADLVHVFVFSCVCQVSCIFLRVPDFILKTLWISQRMWRRNCEVPHVIIVYLWSVLNAQHLHF